MNAPHRTLPEEWRRAPRPLIDRVSLSQVSGAIGEQPVTAKVALYARLPEVAERGGVTFRLEESSRGTALAGIDDGDTPAGYAALVAATAGLRGTLSFPADYDGGREYVTVTTSVMRPLSCPTCADTGAVPPAVSSSLRVEVGPRGRAVLHLQTGADQGIESLLVSALTIDLAEGAELEVFSLSEGGEELARLDRSLLRLGKNSRLSWTEASFETGPTRAVTRVDLAGEGAELDFHGAYGARGRTERERVLVERHQAPKTRSRAILKSVLRDQARLTFRGLIEVFPEAPGTDAYLSNRNLLLDDGARAESLPQLKIDQDDVACSHGSATGGPRDEEVFYLMSRGLTRDDARSMIAVGHLGSVLDRAPEDLALRLEAAALRTVEDRP